jgi:undecaprenyl-diphosphatase
VSQIYDKIIIAIFLAIVQGIAEWLPISSSGHLVIAQEGLGLELPLVFDVMLHLGTLCVVVAVFWRDIVNIISALVKLDFKTEEGRLAIFLVVGSIPTALIGLLFHDTLEAFFYNPPVVGAALFVTGFFLYISERQETTRRLSFLDSMLIGIAQGVAIVPGISRSGLTIATGLLRKVERETAFKYSFLLSMPAIMGATITESRELAVNHLDLVPMVLAVITSFLVGYVSLRVLKNIVMKERLHLFAYYCWIVGIIVVVSSYFFL